MKNRTKTTNISKDGSANSTNIFDHRYYSLNKRILCIIGQWPYQSDIERRCKFVLLSLLSFSFIVPQMRALIFTWGRLDKFVECSSPLGTHIVCNIKLLNTMLHQQKLKNLLDKTRQDWESMRNLPQANIMKVFGEKGRRWSILWFLMVHVLIQGWVVVALTPKILDILKPLNYSRPTFDVMPVDYGIDPVKYWWPIQMHIWFGMTVIPLVLPAFDTLYMTLAQHACAMFEILRYNLDNMIEEDQKINVVLKPDYHADIYYKKIMACIKKHRSLVQYIKDIEASYEMCMLILLGLNMIGLSITGYQAVAKGNSLRDTIRYTIFTINILIHLFIITLPGHWIMSSSAFFPDSVFSCRWYMMSLRSRKLIILLIRASIEPCTITAGKIYVISVKNFCAVLRTSMSYLTVLTSTQ